MCGQSENTNKNSLEPNRDEPGRNAPTSLPIHFQTTMGFTGHCPTHLCILGFSREREGCSGHRRLAELHLCAQTLRTRITRAALPLVQSTPSHSAGQDSQHALFSPVDPQCPPGQPLNAQTCPLLSLPWGHHRLQRLGSGLE